MKRTIINLIRTAGITFVGFYFLTACNKDVTEPVPVTPAAPPSNQTLADLLNDASYSVLKAAVTKAGLLPLLQDPTGVYTFFAPNNAALALSGINEAVVGVLPAGRLDTLLRYHLVGGQRILSDTLARRSPNLPLPSLFVLQQPSPALPPGFRMPVFPSRRGANLWVNNIPVTNTGVQAANGILYSTAAVVAPPSTTLKGILAANPGKFSILQAAIARADSGQAPGLGRLDSVLNYAPANLTFFAPNNDAFRALFPPGTPDAMIIGALNTPSFFTATTVRGIAAYHLLGTRHFSVNFAAGTSAVNTQLVIPGSSTAIPVFVTNNPPAFTVKDIRANSSPATVVTRDVHTVNGVLHELNQVLLPQ